MIELVRRLDRSRWAVHVACFGEQGAWRDRLDSGTPVTAFPLNGFLHTSTVRQARRFAAWCRTHEITLLQTSDFYTNTFFLPAAAAAGVPVRIGSRREIVADKTTAQLALQRAAYACSHLIVANANAAGVRLRREGVSANRIGVVPNGLNAAWFDRARPVRPLRQITMVANLRPAKGQDVLLNALPRVLASHPEVRVAFVGDGPTRRELEEQARAFGIAHAVSLQGHAEDVAQVLADSDVFTLPSDSEAFPNALLEAMAAGLPCVASNTGGVPDMLEHGRTGLCVPPRDPAALSAALLHMLDAPDAARRMGAHAQATARERFSFERMVTSFEHLYLKALAQRVPERAVQSLFASL